MIKLTKKTSNLIGTIVKHIHWNIWSFCLLCIVFKEYISLPLDLLNNFNFIPDFILNLSKYFNVKPMEIVSPEINVIPTNYDELILVFKESILSLQQEVSIMNNNFNKLFVLIQDNNLLIQNQLGFQKELFASVQQKISSFNSTLTKDLSIITNKLQDINTILEVQGMGQVEIATRLISTIKEAHSILASVDNNMLIINKNILSIDINKPLLSLNDTLNQIVINQKDLYAMYQNNQELNLQSFNLIIEMQNLGFNAINDNVNEIFSKMHEIRNHNLGLYQQLTKSFDIKLLEQQTEIVSQITEEINRPKTNVTQATTKSSSWSNIFDKKN